MAEPVGFQARREDDPLDIPIPMWNCEFGDAEVCGGITGTGDPSITGWMGFDLPGNLCTSMVVTHLN